MIGWNAIPIWLFAFVRTAGAVGLLDLLGLRTPTTPPPPPPKDFFNSPFIRTGQTRSSIGDIARQGMGLFSFFSDIQRDYRGDGRGLNSPTRAKSRQTNILGIPGLKGVPESVGLPNIPFLDGVPVVPGVSGSLPGAGACLPKGTPLINPASPSFIQDFLRNIPGAQDLLRSFQTFPQLDASKLVGKWHWVLITPSVHKRSCATTEINTLATLNTTYASFGVFESFREGTAQGSPQISFGYGIKDKKKTSIYTQADPCPSEIVAAGGGGGSQYEYLVISNVAKFPVLGLARDLTSFKDKYRAEMEVFLQRSGYTNFLTQALGSFKWADWSRCRAQTPGNLVGNILNGVFFG